MQIFPFGEFNLLEGKEQEKFTKSICLAKQYLLICFPCATLAMAQGDRDRDHEKQQVMQGEEDEKEDAEGRGGEERDYAAL